MPRVSFDPGFTIVVLALLALLFAMLVYALVRARQRWQAAHELGFTPVAGSDPVFAQRESFIVTFEGWQADERHIEADRKRVPISEQIRNMVSGFLNREVVLPDDLALVDYLDKYTPTD